MRPGPRILIAGGDADPNLGALRACLAGRGVEAETLLAGAQAHPRVTWDLEADVLAIDGEERRPEAVFLRSDVFAGLAAGRPEPFQRAAAWFTAISGWALAHPEVRLLNRASARQVTNKPEVLHLARRLGFEIPPTLVTNDAGRLEEELAQGELIVKPVNGGDFARDLRQALPAAPRIDGSLAAPAIVQRRLVPPEIRVYRIAGRCFPYQLVADALDYRSTAECQVIPLEVSELPEGLTARLAALMDHLQLDFGAADFKADPESGRLRFLEINNSPMFAAFDAVSAGRLTAAMAGFLCP